MIRSAAIVLGLACLSVSEPIVQTQGAASSLVSLVNPFIGTGGHGHTYPGPSMPFGMIQPGPDTRLTGWDSCSGYHYSDSRIIGFSHTHLSGTGIPDYGDILVMPVTGDVDFGAKRSDGLPAYSSAFSHDQEKASPGYYAVTLKDSGIRAELTTTVRAGMHRYTFPAGTSQAVVLDLTHRDEVIESSMTSTGDREISGARRSRSWAKDQRLFFVIRFSRPFVSITNEHGATAPAGLYPGDAAKPAIQTTFHFATSAEPLLLRVGISAVSVDGARRNLDAELPGWDFDAVREAAAAAWEHELGRIRIDGGTHDQRVTFYTALYHAMLTPNVYMDVDGQYLGRDFRVHHADGFTYYSVFSLWDTFRALHPLLTIIDRTRTADFVRTMLAQYRDGGRLPVWELSSNETDTMIGYHAVPVIADAIAKGIPGIDTNLALEAMIHSADEDRNGLDGYKRHGYVDGADASEDVSRTLEYAFDDWCIAVTAQRLNRADVAARFMARAQSWRNLFDPSTGFMRSRVEGHWFAPFDPAEVNSHYTEANAWQYSFFVPQDIDGLIRAHGGDSALAAKLDGLFAAGSQTTGRDQADITGLIGQYAHGNEPSHHIAYLYNFTGQAWKTQSTIRHIVDSMYPPAPDGEIGNDDCGQMSAWYVLSALGFYEVTPASDQYVIGSPLFPQATIRLENGKSFVIHERGGSANAVYIQRAALNGANHPQSFLTFDSIRNGGVLDVVIGATPNRSWGTAVQDRPHSSVAGLPLVPVPFVAAGAHVFRGSTSVTLRDVEPDTEIRYTLDGSVPAASSSRYDHALDVSQTTTVTAVARRADGTSSAPLVASFHQIPNGRTITLSARYANQYNAGGDEALIDTLRGGRDFRNGRWQGYLGTDLTAAVDLGAVQPVSRVSMGFLQDTGSWIFMPKSIRVEVSEDGVTFASFGSAANHVNEHADSTVTSDLVVTAPAARARYVRVTVLQYGPLPDWHPGKGEKSWFFADEIVIER